MPDQQVLCVAEKPAIARAVAIHLSGGPFTTRNIQGNQYVKNYRFDFRFQQWGQCNVTFTCVAGHIVAQDFTERYRKWHSCLPADLFEAPIQSFIAEVRHRLWRQLWMIRLTPHVQDKKAVASNIEAQARGSQILFIWTDCDREGENIGTEVRDIALKVNPRLRVYRARFSNIERA